MSRQLATVIDEMLEKFPQLPQAAKDRLGDVRESALYCAPEMLPFWWKETGRILDIELADVHEPWTEELANFFSGTA